jgi:hypothetical protein
LRELVDGRFLFLDSDTLIFRDLSQIEAAAVVHYFFSDFAGRNDTIAHVLAKELRATGVIAQGRLSEKVLAGNHWTTVDTFKKAIVTKNPSFPSQGSPSSDSWGARLDGRGDGLLECDNRKSKTSFVRYVP